KRRHTFRSVLDAADPAPYYNVWPFSTRTSYEWKRGQETGATAYNGAGQPQQRVASTYALLDQSENLLLYSQQFANAVWSAGNVTVTDNAATAPNGSRTAAKVVEAVTLSWHGLFQGFTYVSGTTLYVSVSVKQA